MEEGDRHFETWQAVRNIVVVDIDRVGDGPFAR